MQDLQLLRYSRQILLPEIDIAGQERLLSASVMILGLGGLGSAAGMYLAAAGLGHLVLVDFDRVDVANLQRQIAHGTKDIGRLKVDSAAVRLQALNPDCRITAIDGRLDSGELTKAMAGVDAVVDASDNFPTRFALNQACYNTKTALVSGAAMGFAGQVGVFKPGQADSPCYACLYNEHDAAADTCTESGVIAPLVGIIGSVQALETIKLLTATGVPLLGRLLRLDALTMTWTSARIAKDPRCRVCGDPEPVPA
ncbi:MAG: HesA/MoeB/ThiF family protein [Gammaproteobacteria bacterium]